MFGVKLLNMASCTPWAGFFRMDSASTLWLGREAQEVDTFQCYNGLMLMDANGLVSYVHVLLMAGISAHYNGFERATVLGVEMPCIGHMSESTKNCWIGPQPTAALQKQLKYST